MADDSFHSLASRSNQRLAALTERIARECEKEAADVARDYSEMLALHSSLASSGRDGDGQPYVLVLVDAHSFRVSVVQLTLLWYLPW